MFTFNWPVPVAARSKT